MKRTITQAIPAILFAAVAFAATSCVNLNTSKVIDRNGITYSIDQKWIHRWGPMGYGKPIKVDSKQGRDLIKSLYPHTLVNR